MALDPGFPNARTGLTGSGPAYIHRDLRLLLPLYALIRDCLSGEHAIKRMKQAYLPKPSQSGDSGSSYNQKRYKDYLERAVFYNVAKRTASGLVGQIFARDPEILVPLSLEPATENLSGDGLSANQIAMMLCRYALSFGRAGLLVDYPPVEGAASQADLNSGKVQPVVLHFAPWHVINWRTMCVGARELLCLVVIFEGFAVQDDGFETTLGMQWRVLQLDPVTGDYTVTLYRANTEDAGGALKAYSQYVPLDASGSPLKEIPFMFVGSDSNTHSLDEPPLYDLCALNLAHYRNSADYEELAFMMGQPSYYFAGLTEAWAQEFLQGKVYLGSRESIPLPNGASAGVLQVQSNGLIKEAMDAKERQMTALGAKLVEQKSVQRTATEAAIEDSAENSALGLIATNVSKAMTWALNQCYAFVSTETSNSSKSIKYELNTAFDLSQLDPQERQQLIKEWQAGAISWPELRRKLHAAGIASDADSVAKAAIDAELQASLNTVDPLAFDTTPKPNPPANPADPVSVAA